MATLFTSFMHPKHKLSPVPKSQGNLKNLCCDVCGDRAEEDQCYGCERCSFYVHQKCSELSQLTFKAPQHQQKDHPLTLEKLSAGSCKVCKKQCTSWRYRCGTCGVDLHPDCIASGRGERRRRRDKIRDIAKTLVVGVTCTGIVHGICSAFSSLSS